jgi:hypothetical protein
MLARVLACHRRPPSGPHFTEVQTGSGSATRSASGGWVTQNRTIEVRSAVSKATR